MPVFSCLFHHTHTPPSMAVLSISFFFNFLFFWAYRACLGLSDRCLLCMCVKRRLADDRLWFLFYSLFLCIYLSPFLSVKSSSLLGRSVSTWPVSVHTHNDWIPTVHNKLGTIYVSAMQCCCLHPSIIIEMPVHCFLVVGLCRSTHLIGDPVVTVVVTTMVGGLKFPLTWIIQ